MSVGPLRVPAGLVRLRPVRLRDASPWSRIRLADRAHLEPWEPVADVNWEVRHAISSWPSVCSGLRSEARKGRMLPYVIEVDGGEDLKAHGNIVNHEYEIERDGETVAEVSKKWFRIRDSYGVQLAEDQDVPLILAIAVCVDAMAHD